MTRWRFLAAVAGLLAACVAVQAQAAAELCLLDPELAIQLPSKDSVTVFVTEGAPVAHLQALQLAKITYTAQAVGGKGTAQVTVYDYIPNDAGARFATLMIVSSQPFGAGTVYGSTNGTSGVTMSVTFFISADQRG
jgi:hypothetical protein